VASNSGTVTIRHISGFKEGTDLNNVIYTLNHSAEWIECMAYSPEGTKLGVGSHDNNIYVYDTTKKYNLYAKLTGHSSYITCFDFSLSESPLYIRSNCGAYELLFFNVNNKK
jgi:WD40 repeat protein